MVGTTPTGEPLRTKLGQRNVERLEEAIVSDDGSTMEWLKRQCFYDGCAIGECAHSMVAAVRFLAAKGDAASLGKADEMVSVVRARRDGNGRWRGFPFYYTVMALASLRTDAALEELVYAKGACERALSSKRTTSMQRDALVTAIQASKR